MSTLRDRLHGIERNQNERDGRMLSIPIRDADAARGTATIHDSLNATTSSYDSTNKVASFTGVPVALPTGTPSVAHVTKAYNYYDVDLNPAGGDEILCIHWQGIHEDGTHGEVDWVVMPSGASTPVRILNIDPKSEGQSSGSPVTPHRKRYFSGTLGAEPFAIPEGEEESSQVKVWIYWNDHHNDMVNTKAGASEDYMTLPVHSQWLGLAAGTWNPQTDQEEDEDSPPAWNSGETNYGDGEGEIGTVTHEGYYWHALQSPVGSGSSYEPGTVPTYWQQGEAIEESDTRPLYKIDGLPPGTIPGFTITEFDPGQDLGGDNPFFSTGKFQTYVEDEAGQIVYGPLLSGVRHILEEKVKQGTVGFVDLGLGKRYYLKPSCKVGSAFNAEDWYDEQPEEA